MGGPSTIGARSIFRLPAAAWILASAAGVAGYVTFKAGIDFSTELMWTRPEYSYGLIVPFVAAFLIWQQRDTLERHSFPGSWAGVVILLAALAINVLGRIAALFALQRYAAVVALYGVVLALVGGAVFRRLWVPLLIVLFMIPIPGFLYQDLSQQLQLISSRAGVWVIRLFGASVTLEGNIIDLGTLKLQVAEACSGLRYLFPLMTLGFMIAYFFRVAFWQRAVVFLSSIPITIAINSLRIGLIGISVEYWGRKMAEGVLHDFEGWVVFMFGGALMLAEIAAFAALRPGPTRWRDVFRIELPAEPPRGVSEQKRLIPKSFAATCALLMIAAVVAEATPERPERIPPRRELIDFPLQIGPWTGERRAIEESILHVLQVDDYLVASYQADNAVSEQVNLFVAWYGTQRAGRAPHSPSTCLPAGGWRVDSFSEASLPGVAINGHPVRVNRAVIRQGDREELVYYFFKQRQRILTDGSAASWFLFLDALTENRTDGALVRLITPLAPGEVQADADRRLAAFARLVALHLGQFLPD